MQMAVPVFFLFAVYGVVNAYLPLVLRGMGYSATHIGLLLAVFEIAGLVFPLLLTPLISRRGTYGRSLFFFGLLMSLIPIPLIRVSGFWLTLLFLALYAVGYKGAVPVSDAATNNLLGADRAKYGRVRVMGSIGFVIMNLIIQFLTDTSCKDSLYIMMWFIIPASLFTLSSAAVSYVQKKQASSAVQIVQSERNVCATQPVSLEARSVSGTAQTVSRAAQTVSNAPRKDRIKFQRVYIAGLLLVFLSFFGLVPATRFFSMYVSEYLGSGSAAVLWALSAACEIPFMFYSNRFLKKYGSLRIIVFCTAVSALRTAVYVMIPTIAGAVIGQMMNAVTFGLFHPAAVLFTAEQVPKEKIVLGMTLYSVVAAGSANVLGNALGGIIIDTLGYQFLFVSFASVPAAAFILFLLFRKKIVR